MKRILIALMIAGSSFALALPEAEARRMGGGGSFGKQSQSAARPAPPAQQQAAPNQAANPAQARQAQPGAGQAAPAASPWRGIMGGALLGLGLGALLAHLGIGGALAQIIAGALMIGLFLLLAIFIYRMLRGKDAARPAYAGHGNGHGHYAARTVHTPEIGTRAEPSLRPAAFETFKLDPYADQAPAAAPVASIPPDFDVPAFVRSAKTYFVRLQAAWDRADINDIREFTTPEMFAELRMQLQERGPSPNHTDVVSLDADVLGVETLGNDYMVSVRFSGLISEEEGAAPEPFTEIWNLSKPVSGAGGWALAGIQQVS